MLTKGFSKGLSAARRVLAVIIAAAFALCLCACAKNDGGEINPASELPAELDGTVNPTEAQKQRILQLAAAFRVFGEYSPVNMDFEGMERIVFCLYADSDELEPCDREGFGTVSAEKADEAIIGVFGEINIMDVMRRKYDPDVEQTYYFSNGRYYLMRTDNSAYTYDIVSVKSFTDEYERLCHAAIVSVKRDGENELDLIFSLIPDEASVYRVASCDVSFWY